MRSPGQGSASTSPSTRSFGRARMTLMSMPSSRTRTRQFRAGEILPRSRISDHWQGSAPRRESRRIDISSPVLMTAVTEVTMTVQSASAGRVPFEPFTAPDALCTHGVPQISAYAIIDTFSE
ncbi:hypothetical protein ACFPRL_34495 [Pseudoclavibacter helvolus]